MLMIRLARVGRENKPHFAVVVTEKTNPSSDGNFLERVGFYSPAGKKPELNVKKDRIEYWISKGAKPTETMARLLNKQGFAGMDRFVDLKKRYQIKKKAAEGEAPQGGSAAPAPEKAKEEATV